MLTRRTFLAGSAFLGGSAVALAPARRPNVLVVTTDQESALLPGTARLPNRKRLQDRGVTFTSAFCNTPQCSPARSALLTGLQPTHTKVITNIDAGSYGKPLSPSIPTIGSVFQKAGYSTGYFGKWHLGPEELDKFGFATAVTRGADEVLAEKAAAWIRAQKGPWVAWVSFINPHNIYFPPEALKKMEALPAGAIEREGAKALSGFLGMGYESIAIREGVRAPFSDAKNLEGKPQEQRDYASANKLSRTFAPADWLRYRSYYLDLVEKADAALGTVLDSVADFDGTAVAYTTDHGDGLGEHGLPYKSAYMYEELIHIPLVIAGPKIGRGTRDDLVLQIDLVPTLASMAGVAWPAAMDGFDLCDKKNSRDAVLLEYYGQQHSVNPIRTVRTRKWKLNWYDSGNKELYDLQEDPHELRNLAGEASAHSAQAELEGRLSGWRPAMSQMEKSTAGYSSRR